MELEPCLAPQTVLIYPTADTLREIIDRYRTGMSISKIAQIPGMPSQATIYRWHEEQPLFRQALQASRATIAFAAEQTIADTAESDRALNKDEVAGPRLSFDKLKWVAEVNDPATYGKKGVQDEIGNRQIIFQVVSHIPQSPAVEKFVKEQPKLEPSTPPVSTPSPEPEPPDAA